MKIRDKKIVSDIIWIVSKKYPETIQILLRYYLDSLDQMDRTIDNEYINSEFWTCQRQFNQGKEC